MNIEEIKEKIKELKELLKEPKEELRKSNERTIKIIEKAKKREYTEAEVREDVNSIREMLLKSRKMRKYFEYDDLPSESYLIYCQYKEKLNQWKNRKLKGEEIVFPKLDDFVNQKISDLIREPKEREKHEWLGERVKKVYEREEKNFIEEVAASHSIFTPPSSAEERADELLMNSIAQHTSKLEKILFDEKEWEHYVNILRVLEDSESLYRIAKEKKVNWGRLTYTLRGIGSPIFKINEGRRANLVFRPVFDKIFPFIKTVWKLEDNYGRWIALLKTEGWSKSRVSHFMRRKVDKGIVPSYYFDIVSPSPKRLRYLKSRKKEPIELPEGIWKEGDERFLTHGEIEELLKELCSKIK